MDSISISYHLLNAQLSPHVVAQHIHLSEREFFITEQPAPAPRLAHPEGCAALRIALVTVPRVNRSCEREEFTLKGFKYFHQTPRPDSGRGTLKMLRFPIGSGYLGRV